MSFLFSAEFYTDVGRPEEAIRRAKEAMGLNPYHPNWYSVRMPSERILRSELGGDSSPGL